MRALVLAVALAACSHPSSPRAETRAATCESCHADVAKEHNASFHRVAFTDATYQASLALEEPKEHAFCNGCHAPDGETAGVGCPSCHGEAHTSKRVVAANSCAKCHEFAFNDGRPDLVQRTMTEHEASSVNDTPCIGCHMAEKVKRRNHQFASGHSLTWLRGSLKVSAKRAGDHVHLAIESFAGHAFPTGDMFRRARLLVFAEREDGAIVGSVERTFGRTWGHRPDGLRHELADTRIRGHYEEEIALDGGPIARIRWLVLFERVLAQRGEGNVTLVSSDVIAEGIASD